MSADILDFAARPDSIAPAHIGAAPVTVPQSPTVLTVDRWGQRRADDIATRWNSTDGMPPAYVPVVADAHACLFDIEPTPATRPQDPQRAAWWAQMMETPEYKALHAQTCLDSDLSELGAAALCRQWLDYAEEQKPGDDPGGDGEPIANTMSRIRSTANALKAAAGDVSAAKDMRAGLGMPDQAGQIDPATFRAHFERIRNDATLRAIMNMAGRMRMLAQALQRAKIRHGADEIAGVELTGDPARLLPSELAQLACGIDEIELLALHRLAQRQSLGRSLRAHVKVGRGPIIVSVDESGSMKGERIIAAKALACALAWLAHHQGRWVMLAGFSSGAEWHGYTAAPRRLDANAFLNWLTHFYAGGTTLDAPLNSVPVHFDAITPPAGRVDHIIITDAAVDIPDDLRTSYAAWSKAHDVHTYGIIVGSDDPGDMPSVCGRTWCVPSLDLDSLAVAETLSL